ncbi:MAG: CYCXC family (seleno)protein [Candidatus Palauibacterales bacterium]|nr:CYCXC family (seleno)protein [Candidatus Palauibacterales bacterium]MDP2528345.1 CYCXC family (seleno)protein [Candidatus Palauibacterales bacterium]MDP2584383.1 CYCXC family (seleno)protein [Candidatus Palauibacterales bacterium]
MARNHSGKSSPGGHRRRGRTDGPKRLGIWGPALVLVAAVGFLVFAARPASGSHHPTPRPGITAAKVMPAVRYASDPRIEKVYREAEVVPAELDGIYCYCRCIENMGHRSLLSCFESDHAAGCDICLSEGDMAYRMTKQGRSLDQIRQAIDQTFSS